MLFWPEQNCLQTVPGPGLCVCSLGYISRLLSPPTWNANWKARPTSHTQAHGTARQSFSMERNLQPGTAWGALSVLHHELELGSVQGGSCREQHSGRKACRLQQNSPPGEKVTLRWASSSSKPLCRCKWQLGILLTDLKPKADFYHTKIKLECFSFKKRKRILERGMCLVSVHLLFPTCCLISISRRSSVCLAPLQLSFPVLMPKGPWPWSWDLGWKDQGIVSFLRHSTLPTGQWVQLLPWHLLAVTFLAFSVTTS